MIVWLPDKLEMGLSPNLKVSNCNDLAWHCISNNLDELSQKIWYKSE